jgi:hypothetical protein
MIKVGKSGILAAALLASVLTWLGDAGAFELTGAWAASADQCGKVFTRNGRANEITFTGLSGRHGGGFIIEANRIRGKLTSCMIKSKKDGGKTLNLIVGCATDIILSNIQFNLEALDENTIARQFPGMEGPGMERLEVKYFRCRV